MGFREGRTIACYMVNCYFMLLLPFIDVYLPTHYFSIFLVFLMGVNVVWFMLYWVFARSFFLFINKDYFLRKVIVKQGSGLVFKEDL